MGSVLGKSHSPRCSGSESKLDAKMVEAMQRRASQGTSVKSFESIILKFRKIDQSLRKCKSIFEQFDEDSNGTIDQEELKHCFRKLEISFNEEEIHDLFLACDINENMEEMDWDKNGMVTFKEFLFAFTRWVGIDEVDEDDM